MGRMDGVDFSVLLLESCVAALHCIACTSVCAFYAPHHVQYDGNDCIACCWTCCTGILLIFSVDGLHKAWPIDRFCWDNLDMGIDSLQFICKSVVVLVR